MNSLLKGKVFSRYSSTFDSRAGARSVGKGQFCTAAERCVMFGLNLSARPAEATVNTAADCGDCEALLSLTCFVSVPTPHAGFPGPFHSAPVCCDAAGLQKRRDVFLSLRRPHQPGDGAAQQGPPPAGGGRHQVRPKDVGVCSVVVRMVGLA